MPVRAHRRPLTAEDLAARRPVWEAISELFLDTDTTAFEKEIIRVLAESPYSVAELDDILTYEVQPVLWPNIYGWIWTGFDQQWLEAEILKRRRHRFRMWVLYPIAFWYSKRDPQWRRITKAVADTRFTV